MFRLLLSARQYRLVTLCVLGEDFDGIGKILQSLKTYLKQKNDS